MVEDVSPSESKVAATGHLRCFYLYANVSLTQAVAIDRARLVLMKIVHVCAVEFTAKHLLLPQCEYMRSLGHEVGFVFSPGAGAGELRQRGFPVKEIRISRKISPFDVVSISELAVYLRREKPDVVHTHTSKGGVIGRLAARLAGVPHVIHTIHGFPFAEVQTRAKYMLYASIERWVGRFTDVLLSQSKEDVDTAARLGILARRGAPIYIGNGVDLSRFNKDNFTCTRRAEIRRSLGIGNEPVVTIIARLTLEKGYAELIEALAACVGLPWTALFVGPDDGAKSTVERMVAQHGLIERVRMLGQRGDIGELLAVTDVFVLPSYREGVPRSVIEAQAMGVPAVVTDIRGCREIVLDGQTGIIVPPRSSAELAGALSKLLQDPQLRERLGAAAERHARAWFSETAVFERIAAVYEGLQKDRHWRSPVGGIKGAAN
ncbi:MAG: glycosyltransferase family 4 protein [Bacillota bacterium]